MKKMIMPLVAALMAATACTGINDNTANDNQGNGEATDQTEQTATPQTPGTTATADPLAEAVTFEADHFTITYPATMKQTYASRGTVNAKAEDGSCKLDATYNDMGPKLDQLKTYAGNYVGMMKNGGSTVDEPKIDGKMITIRSVKDDEVNLHFVVMKEDEIGVSGSLKCNKDKETECQQVLQAMMSSITFK